MRDMKKVYKWILVLHLVSLYLPIFLVDDSNYGAPVFLRPVDLLAGIGSFIVFVFFGLFLVHMYVLYFQRKFIKVIRYLQLSAMFLLILLFVFTISLMRDDGLTIAFGPSLTYQILFTILFAFTMFAPDLMTKGLDFLEDIRQKIVKLLSSTTLKEKPTIVVPEEQIKENVVEDVMEEVAAKPVEPEVEAEPEVEKEPVEEELPEVEDKKEE